MTASLFYLYSWDDPTLSTSLRPPSTIVRRKRTKYKQLHANNNCILPNDYSIDIDDFCNSFNPLHYFQLQSTFTFSDLPIATTSFAGNPAIDVLADDLLSSQQCSRGSQRYYFSSGDNGPPIVVDSGASFLVTPLFSDFITGKYTTASRSCESLTGTTKVLGHGPVHWRFLDSNDNSQDIYPQV